MQRAYKARSNPATRLLTIPTTPIIRRTTPTGRTLQGAIIPTNPTLLRSQKIPMIVKRRQRVRPADRTTLIPRAAQHPWRHQGRAEREAELDRIWVWHTRLDLNGKICKCECVPVPGTMRTARNEDSEAACEGLAAVQEFWAAIGFCCVL